MRILLYSCVLIALPCHSSGDVKQYLLYDQATFTTQTTTKQTACASCTPNYTPLSSADTIAIDRVCHALIMPGSVTILRCDVQRNACAALHPLFVLCKEHHARVPT